MKCECSGPGFCQRYRRRMLGRAYEICSATCPAERPCPDADYRERLLRKRAAESHSPSAPLPLPRHPARPGLARRIRTFAAAILEHVAAGLPRLPEGELVRREAACADCRHNRDDHCELCLCPLRGRLRNKLRLPLESCPQKPPRWGPAPQPRWRQLCLRMAAPLVRWLRA